MPVHTFPIESRCRSELGSCSPVSLVVAYFCDSRIGAINSAAKFKRICSYKGFLAVLAGFEVGEVICFCKTFAVFGLASLLKLGCFTGDFDVIGLFTL